MPEHQTYIEAFLLSAKHRADLQIEPEPEELVDEDWRHSDE